MRKFIFISSHALFSYDGRDIYGTGSAIITYIENKNADYLWVKHPIFGGLPTKVLGRIGRKKFSYGLNVSNSRFLPVKSLQEMIITLGFILRYKKKIAIYIGIDPLNGLFGFIAKTMGRVEKLIFYTADYAVQRFDNPAINTLYHLIDRFVIVRSDEVWNVSTRITELRRKQNVPDTKNFFIPNTPPFHAIKRLPIKEIHTHELVTVTTSPKSTDFTVIFEAVRSLSKKYKDIRLKIIGLSNWRKDFETGIKKMGIGKNLVFLSAMSHDDLLRTMSTSAVGLALYTSAFPWTYYSDSMKARDYLVCGLPVIMTDISSTANDIKKYGSGYVVKLEKKALVDAIDRLFKNPSHYKTMREQAVRMAENYDIDKILQDRLRLT